MAEIMMPRMLALAAAALLGAAAAQAQSTDPTRPPAMLSVPTSPGGDVRGGEPRVQTILVSLRPGGRRIAVIDGKTLRQGDRLGDAIVETIRPTEVVLRRGKQRQILKLYRPAARVAAA
jgi:MSHA biogenesis protein MshK